MCVWMFFNEKIVPIIIPISNNFLNSAFASQPKIAVQSNGSQPNIYVINLASRPDKMERVDSLLKSRGIEYQRFEGIKGDEWFDKDSPLTKGEIGCALSHLSIMKNALEKGMEWILIFEDDIHFDSKITQKTFGKAVLEATCCGRNPEVIYFGHCFSKGKFLPVRVNDEVKIRTGPASCGHAYALSREFMKKALKLYNPIHTKIPIDTFMSQLYEKSPEKSACVFPLTAQENIPNIYGEGIVLQYRNTKSDVADRSSDKTFGKSKT